MVLTQHSVHHRLLVSNPGSPETGKGPKIHFFPQSRSLSSFLLFIAVVEKKDNTLMNLLSTNVNSWQSFFFHAFVISVPEDSSECYWVSFLFIRQQILNFATWEHNRDTYL